MTFDRDLEEAMKRMRKEREMEPFYLEHFNADLTTTDSHDVYHLAAERARDRITPSQPSREVERQERQYSCEFAMPGMRTLVWAALLCGTMALLIWGMML